MSHWSIRIEGPSTEWAAKNLTGKQVAVEFTKALTGNQPVSAPPWETRIVVAWEGTGSPGGDGRAPNGAYRRLARPGGV
jgi:hypothetical protein